MIPLNVDFAFRGAGYSTPEASDSLARHRWYLMKESFAPKLVEAAIDSVGLRETDSVVDPFCGSGTVPVTAAQRGLSAYGVEVNPFLSFVSKTKLRNCDVHKLDEAAASVLRAISSKRASRSPLENYSTFSESIENTKWLFNAAVLRAFERGWCTASAKDQRRTGSFLRLALIRAAMDNCNARADGKCLRYRSDWEKLAFGAESFKEAFSLNIARIKEDVLGCQLVKGAVIFNSDSRRTLEMLDHKFRLCITSPPYLNSFDYSDVYRPELFLGKFVSDTEGLKRIRLKTVRSHVQVRWKPPTNSDFGNQYKQTILELSKVRTALWDSRIPLMVQAYFEDMERVLAALFRLGESDAQVWMVVSTSAYGGVNIPVDMILAEIGERQGWFLHDIGVIRHLRHSGHHWNKLPERERSTAKLRESVVVLGKQRKP